MRRERALKVLMVVVGLMFIAGVYPLLMFLYQEPVMAMMLSLYVALGIFLLLAARNPSANRSLIAFTAWSSFAHAAVMVAQSYRLTSERAHSMGGSAALVLIGVALIALSPAKQPRELGSAVGA
jgi:drug/metabolite transporter superfamily protein YnfA